MPRFKIKNLVQIRQLNNQTTRRHIFSQIYTKSRSPKENVLEIVLRGIICSRQGLSYPDCLFGDKVSHSFY